VTAKLIPSLFLSISEVKKMAEAWLDDEDKWQQETPSRMEGVTRERV